MEIFQLQLKAGRNGPLALTRRDRSPWGAARPRRTQIIAPITYPWRTFPEFRLLFRIGHGDNDVVARMTEHSAATGRDGFLRVVQEKLAEAERREREFDKADMPRRRRHFRL